MIALSFRIGLFIAVLGGVLAVLALLPSQLPDEVVVAVQYFISAVNQWSYFLPIDTFRTILVASIAFWTLMAFWDISAWLFTRITR